MVVHSLGVLGFNGEVLEGMSQLDLANQWGALTLEEVEEWTLEEMLREGDLQAVC